MRSRILTLPTLTLLICLSACRSEQADAAANDPAATADPAMAAAPAAAAPETAANTPDAAAAPEAAPQAAVSADPTDIPESPADLPPFPFFKEPEGLVSTFDDKDRRKNFDREHMIAGDKVV